MSIITRNDLYDWCRAHGCKFETINENTTSGMAVKVINPVTSGYTWLDLPFDEKPVRHFTVYRVCVRLGISVMPNCDHLSGLSDQIDKSHS